MTTPRSVSTHRSDLGVIILAAGSSSRMGQPKMLLPWGDTTVIGHLIAQWHKLHATQIAVVISADGHGPELMAELDRLKFPAAGRIVNPQPDRGMFSSIIAAANWPGWHGEISRWVVALGDQPQLRMETLRRLLNLSSLNLDAICQPAFNGRTAHPVVLPHPIFESLKNSRAATFKEFLKLAGGRSVQHVINDPGLTLDLDTPEDYKQARASTMSHEKIEA